MAFRGAAVTKETSFTLDLPLTADFEYALRLLRHGSLLVLDRPTTEMVRHPGQMSQRLIATWGVVFLRENLRILRRHGPLSKAVRGRGSRAVIATLAAFAAWLGMRALCRHGWRPCRGFLSVALRAKAPLGLKAAAALRLVVTRLLPAWRMRNLAATVGR